VVAASVRMREAGPKTPSSTATVTAVTLLSTKVNIKDYFISLEAGVLIKLPSVVVRELTLA